MATSALDQATPPSPKAARLAHRVWREVSRPFRPRSRTHAIASNAAAAIETTLAVPPASDVVPHSETAPDQPLEQAKPYLTGSGAGVEGFHPHQATVEAACIPFIQRLVCESGRFAGPIVEVGTLLGVTTTNMALVKAPSQRIITVDLYCWNPWGFTPDVHEALTNQVLYYLIQTGHVERVRMEKNEFFRDYAGPAPSLVFLDAVHDYEETKKDIQWARQVGAKIIAGHDYCPEFPGVQQAVDEFGGPRDMGGSAWVL